LTLNKTGGNVHFMNNNVHRSPSSETGRFRDLQILDELSNNDALTQRDLSKRMGIALGLVNSYLKNLIAKGYITVRNIPSKRYAYYLTPKGFAEKSRLAYDLLHDYTRIYREAKNNLKQLFNEMSSNGIRKVVFAGSDEVAEIAYITLQETNLELIGIVDDEKTNDKFLGKDIRPLAAVKDMPYDSIVVTTYLKREPIYRSLLNMGLNKTDVKVIFPL
jgi:DNA-binding MarR family transcriptional regulator